MRRSETRTIATHAPRAAEKPNAKPRPSRPSLRRIEPMFQERRRDFKMTFRARGGGRNAPSPAVL
jgi:hypothetical protein